MRILITGASGMLGSALTAYWSDKYEIYSTSRSEFQCNPSRRYMPFDMIEKNFQPLIRWSNPAVILHCAAITDVDYCEDHLFEAMETNGESVRKLLDCCGSAKLVFISTDAVFPSSRHMATEMDPIGPENVYGHSKVRGEQYIQRLGQPHAVARTTPVGLNINPKKKGFVEWIISSLLEGNTIPLFNDVLFSPISVWHLSKALEWIIEKDISGPWHIASHSPVTKFDFGFALADRLNLNTKLIKESSITGRDFKAVRSKDQSFSCKKYEASSGYRLPGIEETIGTLATQYRAAAYG